MSEDVASRAEIDFETEFETDFELISWLTDFWKSW
jgi:hypothetical protein